MPLIFSQLKPLFSILVTAFLLTGCDSETLITQETVSVESEQLVTVESKPDAKIYHWKQISGPKVSIPNKRVSTLEFTAPKVDKDTLLTFELKAVFDWKIRDIMLRDTVEIKVSPILIINGHRLPPEPDPEENNATLLGIDSNNNGVRDDVERWIYINYKDKHPIHIDIAMQAGRAYTKVLVDPSKALDIHDEVSAPIDCNIYYMSYAKYFNEPILVNERIVSQQFLKKVFFNNSDRLEAYYRYDQLLSGNTFSLPKISERKQRCDFDTSKYGN